MIVGCSNLQRAYPAVAIEIQDALGAGGWAYDMNVACSSATFSIQAGVDALRNGIGQLRRGGATPRSRRGHNNFELRDFHFIFGDACTALVLERADDAVAAGAVGGARHQLATKFSNNIRNDFGFLNSSRGHRRDDPYELVFRQNGQQVFKEVCPMVAEHITTHLDALGLDAADVRRFWLHQANLKMNQLIAKGVLGRLPDDDEAPVILDEYANTSLGRFGDRVPPASRRPRRGRPRRDLQLRRRLHRRQRHRPPPLTHRPHPHLTVCGSFPMDGPRKLLQTVRERCVGISGGRSCG